MELEELAEESEEQGDEGAAGDASGTRRGGGGTAHDDGQEMGIGKRATGAVTK